MEHLFDLQDKALNTDNAQKIFEDIAKEVMTGYCILQKGMPSLHNAGQTVDVEYRLLEIEFYYISDSHRDVKNDGSPFVYPRNCQKGGTFLLHSSGVDICFKGQVSQKAEECNGGGLLIRTMLRTEINAAGKRMADTTTLVAGPWDCADALFNYTGMGSFPMIVPLREKENPNYILFAQRYHVEGKITDEFAKKQYCAYNTKYRVENQWGTEEKRHLNRYNPSLIHVSKTEYAPKPWNRHKNSKPISMITEQYKDTVYFSALLAQDYPNEYRQLKDILDQNGIRNDVLHATKDYWCRDYMPVQRCYNNFVQFKYDPDYLKGKSQFRTDAIRVLNALPCKVNNKLSSLVIDGGNVTVCEKSAMTNSGTYADNNEVAVVMTEKVFSENPQLSREEVLHCLHEDFMGTEVLLLPWDKEDICGHTDGIVHNIGKGKILVNLNLYPAQMAQEMRRILSKTFEVIDLKLSKYHPYSWAYINLLQTRDLIIVPGLGLPQDKEALEQIKNLHPEYEDRIYQVNLAPIIKKWNGALNCLSWTVSTEMSKLHHSEQLDKRFKAIIETTDICALSHEDILFAGNYNPIHLPKEIEKWYLKG